MKFPTPRGPLSENLFATLSGKGRHLLSADLAKGKTAEDLLTDDDVQLSLWACYQLHLGGFNDVDDRWEWDPAVLGFRAKLEKRLERFLRHHAVVPAPPRPAQIPQALADLIATEAGPALSEYVQRRATLGQFRELLMHRSLDYLHSSDPDQVVIAGVVGQPKAALTGAAIDVDYYRLTLTRLGLNPAPGAYLSYLPALTFAANNVTAMFGLHRRLRGALLGELAVFEMNQPLANRHYANGLRRLGADKATRNYFDRLGTPITEREPMHDVAARFCEHEPTQAGNVVFGAAVSIYIENRRTEDLAGNWARGRSSLRKVVPARRRSVPSGTAIPVKSGAPAAAKTAGTAASDRDAAGAGAGKLVSIDG
jgi:hypothetical protein